MNRLLDPEGFGFAVSAEVRDVSSCSGYQTSRTKFIPMTKEEQQKFAEEELLNSKRIFKSATPKYDLSWYVKWASSILILIALTIQPQIILEFGICGLDFLV